MSFRHTRRPARPLIHALEARRLLAATLADGLLRVTGTAGKDSITVQRTPTAIKTIFNGKTSSFKPNDVDAIIVSGEADADTINLSGDFTGLFVYVSGGAGDDRINGSAGADEIDGDAGRDTIYGNGGNDFLDDGAGVDLIDGGTGDDRLTAGTIVEGDDAGSGDGVADVYIGGAGIDTISYTGRTDAAVNVSLDAKANDGKAGENDFIKGDIENVTGSALDDVLTGNNAANVLDGGGSDPFGTQADSLYGLGGNDRLTGFYADPGLGDDTVLALDIDYSKRTAPLSFIGTLLPDAFDPFFTGGQAGEKDTLLLDTFTDTPIIRLGSGNDAFTDASQMLLLGNGGADTLTSAADSEDVFLFPATLVGGAGNDVLTSGGLATYFVGGGGRDTLTGDDFGFDVLDYSDQTGPVALSFDGNNANDGPVGERDVIALDTIDRVIGGAGHDTLVGDDSDEVFEGGAGNDLLIGKGGDDDLDGGNGADTLNGGLGADFMVGDSSFADDDLAIDTVDYSDRTDDLFLAIDEFSNGAAGEDDYIDTSIEVVVGGKGNDRIDGSDNSETLVGNGGNDTIVGLAGNDSIVGGDGEDKLYGDDGADTVRGGNGRDLIDGGLGKDKLYGDAGNDVLAANDGVVDILDGGGGTDVALADTGTIKDQLFAIETNL